MQLGHTVYVDMLSTLSTQDQGSRVQIGPPQAPKDPVLLSKGLSL